MIEWKLNESIFQTALENLHTFLFFVPFLLIFLSRGHSVAGVLVCVRQLRLAYPHFFLFLSLSSSPSRDADVVERAKLGRPLGGRFAVANQ